jgi:hypothetical protein
MLLGLSGAETDHDTRPVGLTSGAGVPLGELLVRLVDASLESDEILAAASDECVATLEMDATVDAAAMIANFHMMTRVADSTGTPLDTFTEQITSDLREALDLDDLDTKRLDTTAQP